MENLGEYAAIATSVIGTFAAIAAVTPTPKDDGIAKFLMKIVNLLGANIGAAKNADEK